MRELISLTMFADLVYIVGGLQNEIWCESGECFDLEKRSWSHIRAMNLKRQGHVLIEAEGLF